jgi:hypothetical protein
MNEQKRTSESDDDLRARFGDLRADAERRAPSFASVLERASADLRDQPALGVVRGGGLGARRRVVKVGAWASLAVAATVAGLLLLDGGALTGPSEDDQFAALVAAYSDLSAGAFRSPTSSLLDVPGMELVRGMPSLGLPSLGLDPAGNR